MSFDRSFSAVPFGCDVSDNLPFWSFQKGGSGGRVREDIGAGAGGANFWAICSTVFASRSTPPIPWRLGITGGQDFSDGAF